jgi:uncharacterized membrane protein YeaQ/YmgE (transglycosylase-associated protein family)
MFWLIWVIVGLIAGWATGKIMRGSGHGTFMDIVLGIVGGWIMIALGFYTRGGVIPSIVVATLGPLSCATLLPCDV